LLGRCLRILAACTDYPRRELIVIQHLGRDDAALQEVIARYGGARVPYAGPFHFSRMNNLGVQAAKGEVLVFLNDDIEPIEPSWLERLVAQVERPGVGIAGAQLLYPSGSLQHGGVVIGIRDGCGHVGRGAYGSRFWPWIELTRDVAGVTGACLAIKASLFRDLGGFADEFPVNYNDIDLCLRARAAGHRVIYDAGAKLRHYECQTRGGTVTLQERERWYGRWGDLIEAGDPFYSPHLTREWEDLSLRLETGS
jgi:GT2 family glycosyltransferase